MLAPSPVHIRVNETSLDLEQPTRLRELVQQRKPDADLVIYNGFPVAGDVELAEGDEVILIRRGEIPRPEELEALLVARHGPGVHQKLKAARVGIAGCGGLGSTLAVALARSGVGRLTLVDFDIVEPSNLNRQQFFVDQIGLPKVDALADNLARINPYVELDRHRMRLTAAEIAPIFEACNVVAECFDNPVAKAELSTTMRRKLPRIPLVAVSGIAGYGPASAIRTRRVFGNHFLIGDGETAAQPGRGLLAPKVTVAAGHQANVVLRLLLSAISDNEGE
ncbi:MAG TPA: sulfur carrier protein ThiS adenylyltransferase ThiF [Polyangiaceae bacterium]